MAKKKTTPVATQYMLNGAGEYVEATAEDLANPELAAAQVFTKQADGTYVVSVAVEEKEDGAGTRTEITAAKELCDQIMELAETKGWHFVNEVAALVARHE